MWRFALAALTFGVACYHPTVAGDVPCSADLTCPDDQFCDTHRNPPTCVTQPPTDAPIDMSESGACTKDADCASKACNESASRCVATSAVLFVAPTGSDMNDCAPAAPCATVSHALTLATDSRSFVRLADGTYSDSWLSMGASYIVSGEANTKFGARINFAPGADVHDHIVEIQTGTVVIEGVTLSGGTNEAVRAQGSMSSLTLWRCQIGDSGLGVVDAANGAILTVFDSRIHDGKGVQPGINIVGGTLVIQRSTIDRNDGGGVRVAGGVKYQIENTFIVVNGGNGALLQVGGVSSSSRFVMNTVADNVAMGGTGAACSGTVSVNSSIFVNNGGTQFGTTCTADYSLFSDGAPMAGTGNLTGVAGFAGPNDYHLTAASQDAIDKADPAVTIAVDVDGDMRPNGAHADIGADEHH